MRLRVCDQFLVVCIPLALTVFVGMDWCPARGACDNKCRERQYFAVSTGAGSWNCIYFTKNDCENCTGVACLCLPQVGDPLGNCLLKQMNGVKVKVIAAGACKPRCPLPNGAVSEATSFSTLPGASVNWYTCQ
jgi:hypothetical protein